MITQSGRIEHSLLGLVHFTVRSNSRRVVARWKDGHLNVSLPPFSNIQVLLSHLDSMAPRLLAIRPSDREALFDGKTYIFDDFCVTLRVNSKRKNSLMLSRSGSGTFDLSISEDADLASEATRKAVEKAVVAAARNMAPGILLPRARQIAANLNLRVKQWKISSGRALLGRCNSQKEISLSAVLMLLPGELRDYVICHELAHLSEMNHSEAFHRLCDKYCNGRERMLERELRTAMKILRKDLLS